VSLPAPNVYNAFLPPLKKQTVVVKQVPVQQPLLKQPVQKKTFFVQPPVDNLPPPPIFTMPPQELPVYTIPPAYESVDKSYPMTLEILETPEPMLFQYDFYSTPSPFLT
jgi:hypothetical protein